MKKILSLTLFSGLIFSFITSCAQEPRSSPAAKASGKAGNANISISYSQPSVKGRKVWGDLVPYGKVWRTGANEATTFEVDNNVKVEGQALPKGKYALFTIPGENEWTVIFNKTSEQWGSFRYNQEDDALRVKVKPAKSAAFTEMMTFNVANDGKVILRWENVEVPFKVQ
jgi:Protein of unknown function (DUF2911)